MFLNLQFKSSRKLFYFVLLLFNWSRKLQRNIRMFEYRVHMWTAQSWTTVHTVTDGVPLWLVFFNWLTNWFLEWQLSSAGTELYSKTASKIRVFYSPTTFLQTPDVVQIIFQTFVTTVQRCVRGRHGRGEGQGHKILSLRCPRGRGQSSRTPSLQQCHCHPCRRWPYEHETAYSLSNCPNAKYFLASHSTHCIAR